MNSPKLSDLKSYLSKRKINIICSVSALVIMWLVWIVAYYTVNNDYVIPSFNDAMVSLWECIISATFWTALLNTLLRTVIAFVISFALAVLTAVLSAVNKVFALLIRPFMVLLRTLPTLAVILLLLIWTSPNTAPVIVTVLILFPMMYSQMVAAIGGIDEGLIEMARVYNLGKKERLTKIYLPLILPNVLSQTGANFSLGIKIMISAEVLANTYRSFGGLMQNARLYVEMPKLAALTLAAVLLGLVIEIAFSQLERVTFKWSRKENRHD